MLDYTKAAIAQTLNDLKKLFYYIGLFVQIVYIGFLVYSMALGTGIFAINLALAILSTAYFIFHLITTKFGKDPDANDCKRLKKNFKEAMKWLKRGLRLITIGVAFVELYTADVPDVISVVLTAFMVLGWIADVLFDLVVKILNNRYRLIMDGLELDIDAFTKPFKSVGNFFKKMTGQEVEPEKELTANQIHLKETVLIQKEEKTAEKQTEKLKKSEEKERKRQAAKELKKSTKAEKALLKAAKKKEKTKNDH